ncbi:hypothetical protein TNCV_5024871 [Trichonephila clavipes]|nr:hypothetical protein TNCV_5024871 [Trichonephila clavipes]
MWPRLTHIHPSNNSTQLLWSCHAAPLVKVDSIQMRICRPFPRLPGTEGQERQRSLYPSHVDCHWQAKLYNLVTKAWTEQTLTPWIHVAQMELDGQK